MEATAERVSEGAMLTAAEAGARLGISARKVYELADTGELPHYRIGRAVRFAESDVLEYRTSCRSAATKKTVVGALSLTAASLAKGESALESAFRHLGVALKPTRSTAKNRRGSTLLPAEPNALKLVSKTR